MARQILTSLSISRGIRAQAFWSQGKILAADHRESTLSGRSLITDFAQ